MKILKNTPLNYSVQLLLDKEPLVENLVLLDIFKETFGNVEILFSTDTLISFVFNNYCIKSEGVSIPIQILLIKESHKFNPEKILEFMDYDKLDNETSNYISQCTHSLMISDFMGTSLNYKKRIFIFNEILKVLIPIFSCKIIYWPCSQNLVNSNEFFNIINKEPEDNIHGLIKVRHFIKNELHIMDTVGFSQIGLPDLQCSFTNIESGIISTILYEYSRKLYENDDFFKKNEKIYSMNLEFSHKYNYSIINPKRIVIELHPIIYNDTV